MKCITRLLAIGSLGLGAALAIGTGPAQASTAAAQPAGQGASMQVRADWNDDNGDVVGYFRTRIGCERVGRLGEYHGRWDDYDCSRVRFGFNRGAWVLEVSTDEWNGSWDNDNWYSGWYDSWHGGDFDGGWDHGGWNHGGWDHGGWDGDHGGWDGDHHGGSGSVTVFPLGSGTPIG